MLSSSGCTFMNECMYVCVFKNNKSHFHDHNKNMEMWSYVVTAFSFVSQRQALAIVEVIPKHESGRSSQENPMASKLVCLFKQKTQSFLYLNIRVFSCRDKVLQYTYLCLFQIVREQGTKDIRENVFMIFTMDMEIIKPNNYES